MILELTDEELNLFPNKKHLISHGKLSIEPLDIQGFSPRAFVKGFLERRGVLKPKIEEVMLAGFSSVDMHVDNLSSASCGSIAIFLEGNGKLYHTVENKIKSNTFSVETEYVKAGEAVIFDFNLPHQFVAKSNCVAILADVRKKQLQSLK